MTSTVMKKEEELVCPDLEAHTALLKSLIRLLPSKSISRAELNENLRQCESLKIAIQARLVSHVN